jgi:hypothetical protein
MKVRTFSKLLSVLAIATILSLGLATPVTGQEIEPSKVGGVTKKDQKKIDKDAKKLAKQADKVSKGLGRDVVFCILAAHTTDIGTAQELKDMFEALVDVPFGQFVAAVIMADRLEVPLEDILAGLEAGKSLGQIAKELDIEPGELRQGLGQFISELARSLTNPPTRDCFRVTP